MGSPPSCWDEEASKVEEAMKILKEQRPSSGMNLVVAGVDGIARAELNPGSQPLGAADIRYGIEQAAHIS